MPQPLDTFSGNLEIASTLNGLEITAQSVKNYSHTKYYYYYCSNWCCAAYHIQHTVSRLCVLGRSGVRVVAGGLAV